MKIIMDDFSFRLGNPCLAMILIIIENDDEEGYILGKINEE